MRKLLIASLLMIGFSGCGGETAAITDPSKLPALTEEQKKGFEEETAKVQEEEGGGFLKAQAEKKAKAKK